jgi:phosphoglycolate phosphatase
MNTCFASKKHLIFDLDGTLADSVPDLSAAVNLMLTDLKLSTVSTNVIRSWVGNGATTLVQRALDSHQYGGDFEHALAEFMRHYQTNVCTHTQLYPHVASTLKQLKSKGYILSLATNKPTRFIDEILSGLALTHTFALCIGGDSLKERKPHPLPLEHICSELNLSINDTVMIGDSKNDILAAKACHMHSIGLTYGYNYGENIGDHNPDYVFDHFEELLTIL